MDDETFTKKIWSVYPKTMIGRAQKKNKNKGNCRAFCVTCKAISNFR